MATQDANNTVGPAAVADGASVRESAGARAIAMNWEARIDNRRRIGARFAIQFDAKRLFFLLCQQLFRDTFGRLPRDVVRTIVYYYKQIAMSCVHAFLPCPVCRRSRCQYCGIRFATSGGDPRPCACPRPTRTSTRLADIRFAVGRQEQQVMPLTHAALHMRFPGLYQQ